MLLTSVAALAATVAVAGCGGVQRMDAHEPSGTFKVDVVKASFPAHQRLSQSAEMRVVVRNAGNRTIPDVAVSVTSDQSRGGGFTTRSDETGLADPTKQVWIVDRAPRGGDTAYVSTWALGPLRAGQKRTFVWHVTPVTAGSYTLRYRIAAGLNGKARAVLAHGGGEPAGVFHVRIAQKAPQATVDPATGKVVVAGQ